MKTITYCKRWNRVTKAPFDPMTTKRAAKLHQENKPYCVVIEDGDDIRIVEMCFFKVYCHVLFLDKRKRVQLRYGFIKADDERLFLEEAAIHHYPEDSDFASHGEVLIFKPDGTMILEKGTARGQIEQREGTADVEINYSPIPEFGNYEEIIRRDR